MLGQVGLCPQLLLGTYPFLLLAAVGVPPLPLHLQAGTGQALLGPGQLLQEDRLLRLLQGQRLGGGRPGSAAPPRPARVRRGLGLQGKSCLPGAEEAAAGGGAAAHLLLLTLGQQEALVPLLLQSCHLLAQLLFLRLVAGQQLLLLLRQAVQQLFPLGLQL